LIRGICDKQTRLAARVYLALQVGCGCCTFWRGVLLGAIAGLVVSCITLTITTLLLA
jgi:hypothetical protein